jgi:hypothetical protein
MIVGATHEDLFVDVLGCPLEGIKDRKVEIAESQSLLGCHRRLFLGQDMICWLRPLSQTA